MEVPSGEDNKSPCDSSSMHPVSNDKIVLLLLSFLNSFNLYKIFGVIYNLYMMQYFSDLIFFFKINFLLSCISVTSIILGLKH